MKHLSNLKIDFHSEPIRLYLWEKFITWSEIFNAYEKEINFLSMLPPTILNDRKKFVEINVEEVCSTSNLKQVQCLLVPSKA